MVMVENLESGTIFEIPHIGTFAKSNRPKDDRSLCEWALKLDTGELCKIDGAVYCKVIAVPESHKTEGFVTKVDGLKIFEQQSHYIHEQFSKQIAKEELFNTIEGSDMIKHLMNTFGCKELTKEEEKQVVNEMVEYEYDSWVQDLPHAVYYCIESVLQKTRKDFKAGDVFYKDDKCYVTIPAEKYSELVKNSLTKSE